MFAAETPEDPPVVIPQPNYDKETPSEALEDIIKSTITLAQEMGEMSDDQVNEVLEKVLNDRINEFRKNTFKMHDGKA